MTEQQLTALRELIQSEIKLDRVRRQHEERPGFMSLAMAFDRARFKNRDAASRFLDLMNGKEQDQ